MDLDAVKVVLHVHVIWRFTAAPHLNTLRVNETLNAPQENH